MKSAKSPTLKSLLQSFRKAAFAEKFQNIDTETLIQLDGADDYSRRKFLIDVTKTLGAVCIGSLLPLSGCDPNGSNKENSKETKGNKNFEKLQPTIAIVGAGISGLHAAYVLKKAGFIAQIYEGDSRIGGRIHTKSDIFGVGLVTEFGGEFIDSNHADMLNLAKEFNLELYDTQKDIIDNKVVKDAYFFNNRHYTEKEVISEFRRIVKRLESDKKKCGEDYDTPYAEKLDNTSLEQYARSLTCSKWLQDLIIYAYVGEFGLDAGEQSALNFIDMIDTDVSDGFKIFGESDERYKLKGGNVKIVEALSSKVQNQINADHKLTAIRSQNGKTTLVFNGSKEVSPDFVIISIPFTILRSIDIKIDIISEDKMACIKNLGYGQNNKLLLGFNSRVWRDTKPSYSGYLFHNDIHNGWDNTHMQASNQGAGSYTIFLGGKPSIDLAQAAKAQNLKDTVPDSIVQSYLKKLNAVFPNAEQQFSNTHKAALWSNNPFINASYACFKVGQWSTISGKEFEPVGNLHFAGEHCSEDFQGYMNGGAETGRRAAENLLAIIKK